MRKFKLISVMFAAFVALGSYCSSGADTSWMAGSFGLGFHWTAQMVIDRGHMTWNEAVNHFDTEALAKSVAASGAKHIIFTTTHAREQLPCPNAHLDAALAGRTATRDLLADLITSCTNRGIKVIFYYNHACNGMDDTEWKAASGYNDITDAETMSVFAARICGIVQELSDRYGKGVSGWWFDSSKAISTVAGQSFPWEDLLAAARHGNADAAIAVNYGNDVSTQGCPGTDYFAGESEKINVYGIPNSLGIADHIWTCADSKKWVYNGTWDASRFASAAKLNEWILAHRTQHRMATLNVLIDDYGTINANVLDQTTNRTPVGVIWEQTKYKTADWQALPTASNALRGITAEFSGTRLQESNRGMDTTSASVLTDGKNPGAYNYSGQYGVANGAVFTWTLASAVDLYGFNAYSVSGGGGRDGFAIAKIEVMRKGESQWTDLSAPQLDFGRNEQANLTGGCLAAKLRNAEGSALATGITKLRVTFGAVDNDGICFAEMEALTAPVSGGAHSSDF